VFAAHGGVVIGSETAGGIADIFVDGCRFIGTERGVRLKTRRGRGGKISNIQIRDITAEDVWCPITINMYYRPGLKPTDPGFDEITSLEPQPITNTTPEIDGVVIENVQAINVRSQAAFIVGLPEQPIRNVTISNYQYTLAPVADLLSTEYAAMTGGLFADDDRGIKVINAETTFLGGSC
jgi:polygalacturonase